MNKFSFYDLWIKALAIGLFLFVQTSFSDLAQYAGRILKIEIWMFSYKSRMEELDMK